MTLASKYSETILLLSKELHLKTVTELNKEKSDQELLKKLFTAHESVVRLMADLSVIEE